MPTFPRSPLSFRTAGFPQYGWKAGFPSGACLDGQRLKPAHPTSSLHPPFVRLVVSTVVPLCVGPSIAHRRGGSLLLRPRGPRSSPGYSVPNSHCLFGPIRPTRGHIAGTLQRGATSAIGMPTIRNDFSLSRREPTRTKPSGRRAGPPFESMCQRANLAIAKQPCNFGNRQRLVMEIALGEGGPQLV